MPRKYFALAKSPPEPSDDVVAARHRDNLYVVSDGASACYDGRGWADTLVKSYIREPDITLSWLQNTRRAYRARATPRQSDWLGTIAFERGSFATLLGFHVSSRGVTGTVFGDSVLFIAGEHGLVMHPVMMSDDFEANPLLLSSHTGIGQLPDTEAALCAQKFRLPAPEGGWGRARLFAMTDALAAWVVAGADRALDRLDHLASVEDGSAFERLVRAESAAGRMRIDDATLIMLQPDVDGRT